MLYVVELIVYSDGLNVDCHGSFLYTIFRLYDLLTIKNYLILYFLDTATYASFIYLHQSQINIDEINFIEASNFFFLIHFLHQYTTFIDYTPIILWTFSNIYWQFLHFQWVNHCPATLLQAHLENQFHKLHLYFCYSFLRYLHD
jgi:hypothetical protein